MVDTADFITTIGPYFDLSSGLTKEKKEESVKNSCSTSLDFSDQLDITN